MLEQQAKEEVIAAGNELVARGLVARTWGNVSCRIDETAFAITPSGIAYERLTPDKIVVVDIASLEHTGDVKPSSEKGIHAAAYRLDPAVNFVIHTHQTYATCLSVAGYPSLSPTAEETAVLGGNIALAGYGLPGTKKLRANVEQALSGGSTAVLMEHHGALVTGPDRATAFRRAVTLEDVCKRAACETPMSACHPDVMSRRVNVDSFKMEAPGGETATLVFAARGMTPTEQLHAALYAAYPDFGVIMHLSSEAVDAVMAATSVMPAILDDFAQMVGSDVKICPALPAQHPEAAVNEAVRAIKGRNCVCVRGLGAVCCIADASDCAALLTLVEKNALAYLNANANAASKDDAPALSWLDKKLMRFIYTTKYSKKK